MKRFDGKVRLFCISNVMVSFIGTGFLGINGYTTNTMIEGPVQSAHEISLTSSDTEPVSQYWDGEANRLAFISNNIEAVIGHQENTCPKTIEGENNNYSLITEGIKAVIDQHEETEKTKETTKKTTTKKTTKKTNVKKTTNVVTKKEVSKSVTYKPASYSSVTGDAIVSYARKYMGLPYKTGTPSLSRGSDCSGFTMLIYREFGVSLPRTVGGQTGRGTYVSKSNLQKGDLVFYKAKGAKGGATHVAIYIGGGQVIHESRPGVGVKISPVNMMQYVTARRVINSTAKKIAEQKTAEEQNKNITDTTSTSNIAVNTQDNKNEGNVDNNVVATPTSTPTPAVTTTPTPTITTPVTNEVKEEVIVATSEPTQATETPKVEEPVVKEAVKVEVKEEPKPTLENSVPVEQTTTEVSE